MKYIVAFLVSILAFAVVPVTTHWWLDIIFAIEISVIAILIASSFINSKRKRILPPQNKGNSLIQHGHS